MESGKRWRRGWWSIELRRASTPPMRSAPGVYLIQFVLNENPCPFACLLKKATGALYICFVWRGLGKRCRKKKRRGSKLPSRGRIMALTRPPGAQAPHPAGLSTPPRSALSPPADSFIFKVPLHNFLVFSSSLPNISRSRLARLLLLPLALLSRSSTLPSQQNPSPPFFLVKAT